MENSLHGENQQSILEIEKIDIQRLTTLLDCNTIRMNLRLKTVNDGYSGVIFCGRDRFPIKYSIPVLVTGNEKTRYKKLRAAYEAMGFAPWRAKNSDWIKHMRVLQYKGLKKLLDLIRSRESSNILVLGCGWGWEIWVIKELINRKKIPDPFIVGVDLTRKPLIIARKIKLRKKAANIVFSVGFTDNLPFKRESFDAVVAIFGPLDHTEKYEKSFIEIGRVLKREGYFFFTVLNRFSLDWIMRNLRSPKLYVRTLKKAKEKFVRVTLPTKRRAYRLKTHYYDIFEVKKLLSLSNFRIIKHWSIFSILAANFRKKRFSTLDRLLSEIELLLAEKPIIRSLGRYIAVIAEKT